MKPVKVLYFVDGIAPTADQIVEANSLAAHVCFRNARAIPAEGALEECDGVTGVVPQRYADKYPSAEKAIEARAEALAKLAAKAGDESPASKPAKAVKAAAEGASTAATEAAKEAADGAGTAAPAGSAWSK